MKRLLTAICLSVLTIGSAIADSQSVAINNLSFSRNEHGIAIITGEAFNKTEKILKVVFIKFNLYNSQDSLVGNTIAHAQELKPHGKWIFQARAVEEFTKIEVSDIQAY